MDYTITAKKLIEQLGGRENVASLTHCMTRLRFVLKDESSIDDKLVEEIPGVMGVAKKGGQYQVIIGNNVAKCYAEINKLYPISDSASSEQKKEKRNLITVALDFISGCMTPMVAAITAGGLIKVLLVVLGPSLLNALSTTSDTYIILNAFGDAIFYFLPIFVAITASKKLGCNTYLAVLIAAVLLYPDLITLLGGDTSTRLFGFIPVIHGSYSSSVIPAMLSTILLKYVEILVDKITPEWSKNFLKPLLIVIITAPITLCLLAPLGLVIGEGLQFILNWIYNLAPWLAMALFAAFMPFIIMTGMHWAFIPAAILAMSNPGYEMMFLPAMLATNIAQAGATFGVAVKTKDAKMRQVAIPAGISALFAGVTEPAMYGVTLKLKKPIYAVCIAGGIGGLIAGLAQLRAYAFTTPSLPAIVQFIAPDGNRNFVSACIVAVVSFAVAFVLALLLTKNKKAEKAAEIPAAPAEPAEALTIYNPVNGKVIPLQEVNDSTFSSGVLGNGYAVIPTEGKVYAPFSGTVETLMDTHHALGLLSDDGIEMLIHVGLETVSLQGKHFTPKVAEGDTFQKGDVLLEFDLAAIQAAGFDTATPVLVSNADNFLEFAVQPSDFLPAGEKMMTLVKQHEA